MGIEYFVEFDFEGKTVRTDTFDSALYAAKYADHITWVGKDMRIRETIKYGIKKDDKSKVIEYRNMQELMLEDPDFIKMHLHVEIVGRILENLVKTL